LQPRHERIAKIALAAGARYGLALAAGYAVQAHGIGNRPSGDVDLFTTWQHRDEFPELLVPWLKPADRDRTHRDRSVPLAPPVPATFSPTGSWVKTSPMRAVTTHDNENTFGSGAGGSLGIGPAHAVARPVAR